MVGGDFFWLDVIIMGTVNPRAKGSWVGSRKIDTQSSLVSGGNTTPLLPSPTSTMGIPYSRSPPTVASLIILLSSPTPSRSNTCFIRPGMTGCRRMAQIRMDSAQAKMMGSSLPRSKGMEALGLPCSSVRAPRLHGEACCMYWFVCGDDGGEQKLFDTDEEITR